MIREVKREKEGLDEKKLKEVIAGIDTGQHGDCSCRTNCGSHPDSQAAHANNRPI